MDKDLRPRQLTGYSRRTHLSNALFLLPTIVLFTFVVLIPFFSGNPLFVYKLEKYRQHRSSFQWDCKL